MEKTKTISFDQVRKEVFRRLKTEDFKATNLLLYEIQGLIENRLCLHQVAKDLTTYPLYDAVAMWMDKEIGLAAHFPEDMERVARLLRLEHKEKVIFKFGGGVTERSKETFKRHRKELGRIRLVTMWYNPNKGNYFTAIVGEDKTLIVDGFAVGYRGEGPGGFLWLLKECGIKFGIGGYDKGRVFDSWGEEDYSEIIFTPPDTIACESCKNGVMVKTPERDKPFDKDTFGGEGVWEAYVCDRCGEVHYEPLD